MPVYGRYEPAEAMRDLGLSLGKIVTDMAETELQSRKMDLALKESDLKLGMLEKEAQIGTLKTQLEGEATKTKLYQEGERLGLAKEQEARLAKGQEQQNKIALANLGLAQAREGREAEAYARSQKKIAMGEFLEKFLPHRAAYIKQSMTQDQWNKEITMEEAQKIGEFIGKEKPAEIINSGVYQGAQKVAKIKSELEGYMKHPDPAAMEAAEAKFQEYQKITKEIGLLVDIADGKDRFADILESTRAYYAKIGEPVSEDELLKHATQAYNQVKEMTKSTIKNKGELEDLFVRIGVKQYSNPISESDIKEAFDGKEGIMKKPAKERESAFAARLSGIDADPQFTPGQKRALKERLTAEWEARRAGKPKKEATPKPETVVEEPKSPETPTERYAPVATTLRDVWGAFTAPVPQRPGWNERRFQEWNKER